MAALETTFWISLFVIAYAYVGYPAVLWIVSRIVWRGWEGSATQTIGFPSVSIIVSAYNEENVIGEIVRREHRKPTADLGVPTQPVAATEEEDIGIREITLGPSPISLHRSPSRVEIRLFSGWAICTTTQ